MSEDDVDNATCVAVSRDWLHALSGAQDGDIRLWRLDWELEAPETSGWDEAARPILESFLASHTPYAGALPRDLYPTPEEVTLALTRQGNLSWTEQDFQQLLQTLGCAGHGWLRPEDVRCELHRMAAGWESPPPLPRSS